MPKMSMKTSKNALKKVYGRIVEKVKILCYKGMTVTMKIWRLQRVAYFGEKIIKCVEYL